MELLVGSDQILVVTGVQRKRWDHTTQAFVLDIYLNAAAVNLTLKDRAGNVVIGPLALTYVTDSNGDYEAIIQDSVTLIDGNQYVAEIDIDGGADTKLLIREKMVARYQDAAA